MVKVSVIIPVYNAQEYLKRCLDSICNQTLREIEILCVNDCSTDNSLVILNEYAQKYSNMKVINCKVNGGESVARNIGLDNATGEYIGFVDNDDEIDLDFYEKLYAKARETGAEIVKGNVKTIAYDGTKKDSELNPKLQSTGNKWYFHYEWWSAIYHFDLIKKNKIRLPAGYILGGDSLFLINAVSACQKFACISDCFYYYYRRETSGDSLILSHVKISSSLEIFSFIFEIINLNYIKKRMDMLPYVYLSINYIELVFSYVFRTDSESARECCCKYILKFVSNCLEQEKILNYIMEKHTAVYKFVKYNNLTLLIAFINNLRSVKEYEKHITLAKLRYRVEGKQ